MRKFKATLLALTVALGIAGAAFGDDRDREWRNRDSGNYSNGPSSYRQGYEDGARQAEHDLRRGNRSNLNQGLRSRDRSYREGYQQAYDRVTLIPAITMGAATVRYTETSPTRTIRTEMGVMATGRTATVLMLMVLILMAHCTETDPVATRAYRIGYTDGLADGRSDRSSGHSFRPTQGDNFKHADRGYNSGMGDKQLYKDTYRQGYQASYPQGFQGDR